jgi:YihY family inner membrane protein
MDVLGRADEVQQRRAWLAFPLAVYQKFSDDQAGNLASLLAYYAFFSVFPLLLVLVTVLGFVLQSNPDLQQSIYDTVKGFFPALGEHDTLHPLEGSVPALVIGLALALFSGLSVVSQAQAAFNTVLAVPRADWPGFVPRILRSLELLVVGGGGLILTTLISGAVTGAGSFGFSLGVAPRILGAVLAIVLDALLFTFLFLRLTVRKVSWRQSLPGATFAAVSWYALQLFGTALVAHTLKKAGATYGTFAAVIGLLTFFHVQAQLTLYAAEINAVRIDRLWPRGLRSFVNSPTTDADHRAYASYAERDRFAAPEEEQVEVTFPQRDGAVTQDAVSQDTEEQ